MSMSQDKGRDVWAFCLLFSDFGLRYGSRGGVESPVSRGFLVESSLLQP